MKLIGQIIIIIKAVCFSLLFVITAEAQTPSNIHFTHPDIDSIIKGNYDPSVYFQTTPITDPDEIICRINSEVNLDSLKNYLIRLSKFHTRHTWSDTTSPDTGIGACRNWLHSKWENLSATREDRVLVSFLQFDLTPHTSNCGAGTFKNICAILPGSDSSKKEIVILEAHIDSRCESRCDVLCKAHGMEDNGSGTALVMELARVMSQFTFDRTIIFMATVGEEQGLYGGHALAQYCQDNGILIRGVQNNDVIGGVICGETSSPPSCTSQNHIDSTNVRLFSFYSSQTNSQHRGYARFVKMVYEEKVLPISKVPMTVHIINQEDRTGRGGDHIPFRQRAFTSIRFTSANEHGDGSNGAGYNDRQHTVNDTLGVDTDNDGIVDSFFVSFNYLKRNSVLNGVAAAIACKSEHLPQLQVSNIAQGVLAKIINAKAGLKYRIGVRADTSIYFDAVYETSFDSLLIPNLDSGVNYQVSAASLDAEDMMSPFNQEFIIKAAMTTASANKPVYNDALNCAPWSLIAQRGWPKAPLEHLNIYPNPFSIQATIQVQLDDHQLHGNNFIEVFNAAGRTVDILALDHEQDQQISLLAKDLPAGIYFCSLVSDGQRIESRKLSLLR